MSMNSFVEASKELHEANSHYGKASEYSKKGTIKYELTIPSAVVAAHRIQPIYHILDHGCGKGGLVSLLDGHDSVQALVDGYDPAVEKFKHIPNQSYDIVTSVDVLEHIGREHVNATLLEIKKLTGGFFFFCIDLLPANKKLGDGRNAHVLLAPADWWVQQIKTHFKVITAVEAGEMSDGSSYPMRLMGCAANSIKKFDLMTEFLRNIRIANKEWVWLESSNRVELR